MLAMIARAVPCRARFRGRSSGRERTILPESSLTSIGAAAVQLMLPLGPVSLTVRPEISAFTPAGSSTGFFPILDIESPHGAKHFAADVRLAALAVAHYAAAGRNHRDPQPVQHA